MITKPREQPVLDLAPPKMKLIGLYGEMESGKDTVADILIEEFHYYRVSVGRHIREELAKRPHVPTDTWVPYDLKRTLGHLANGRLVKDLLFAKPTTPEIRGLLQWWGTYRRCQHALYWLNMVVAEIKDGQHDRIVFSDLRVPAEFQMANMYGETWRVIRCNGLEADTIGRKRAKYGELHDHVTETSLDFFPFQQYISNNGDIQDLKRLVRMIAKEYKL